MGWPGEGCGPGAAPLPVSGLPSRLLLPGAQSPFPSSAGARPGGQSWAHCGSWGDRPHRGQGMPELLGGGH